MSAIISDAIFTSDIISFKDAAQKSNLKSSISGITVANTGLPINGIDFAERSANLISVQNLEEKERSRRAAETPSFAKAEFSRKISSWAASALTEAERARRLLDTDGSEEYRELLARKVTASIAKDILTGPARLEFIARGAIDSAKQAAKQAGQDMLTSASGFASRAVSFFGRSVSTGIATINENLHDISDKAIERAQEFGGQATEKANGLADKAFDKVQDLREKAVSQAQNLKFQATSTAQEVGEKAIHFGAQKYGDALRMIAIGKLDFAEEVERQYRTTIGLSFEKFFLALQTSALVREYWIGKGQYDAEFSSWYGTGILEEFERRRRIQHDRTHSTSQDNAKKVGQLIHLRNIQTESYKPQVKQLENLSVVVGKKAEEIRLAPTRAAAAM